MDSTASGKRVSVKSLCQRSLVLIGSFAPLEPLFLVEAHCFTEQEVTLFFCFHTHAA